MTKPSTADVFSPFVVFGAAKSGTTWLQQLLDLHPEIRCHFQLPIFPVSQERMPDLWYRGKSVFNAGHSPFSGVFASEKDEAVYQAKNQYMRSLDFLFSDYLGRTVTSQTPAVTEELGDFHKRLVGALIEAALCDTEEKSIFGTKAYTDLDLLFDVFPKARLIHIVRDGRDVAVSKRFHNLRQGFYFRGDEAHPMLRAANRVRPTRMMVAAFQRYLGLLGEDWHRPPSEGEALFTPDSLECIAQDWTLCVQYIRGYREARRDQWLEVRYEDMRADPGRELHRVLQFLEVSDESCIDTLVEQTRFEKMRRRGGFYRSGESGGWRKYFSDEDVAHFKEIAGDLLLELGYEDCSDWKR